MGTLIPSRVPTAPRIKKTVYPSSKMKLYQILPFLGCVAAHGNANDANIVDVGMNCIGLADMLYPHPDDCAKFFQCSNGVAYEHPCAEGTEFNYDLRVCDNTANFTCDSAYRSAGWEDCTGTVDNVKYASMDTHYYFTCNGGVK